MASTSTLTEAYRANGLELRNRNWSWSARSENAVVVSLWQHEFKGLAGNMIYERQSHGDWYKGVGYRFLIEDLAWAVAHFGGIVGVVVVVRDSSALPRVRVSDCYAAKKLLMRVTHLDPATGAFRLEQVAPTNMPKLVTAPRELVQAA
jgi:hypothetical protein